MKKTASTVSFARFAIVFAALGAGCGDSDSNGDNEPMIASSESAPLIVYDDPYAPAMAGTPNPISGGATASAEAFDVDGKLRIELTVAGFPATRAFGSHLHRLACDDPTKAGGHYQNMPFPAGGMATDPEYANATNEAWLDFTTDAMGRGESNSTVNWLPRTGEAQAIIIHDMPSGVGGVSGAKLACLPLTGL